MLNVIIKKKHQVLELTNRNGQKWENILNGYALTARLFRSNQNFFESNSGLLGFRI